MYPSKCFTLHIRFVQDEDHVFKTETNPYAMQLHVIFQFATQTLREEITFWDIKIPEPETAMFLRITAAEGSREKWHGTCSGNN